MSIKNFIQHQRAINEASLVTYYNNADKSTKAIAKKLDSILTFIAMDKKQQEEITELITDLADAYAEERIDSQKMDESKLNEGAMSDIDQLAKDSPDFKAFVKAFKKEYSTGGSIKELEAWLKTVYDAAVKESNKPTQTSAINEKTYLNVYHVMKTDVMQNVKDLNYTLTNLQKIYSISNQDMQATVDQIQAVIDNSNKKR